MSMLAELLGIKPSEQNDIRNGVSQLRAFGESGGFDLLAQRLKCADANLDAMRQLLEREYGKPMKNPISFDPFAEPSTPNRTTSSTADSYDFFSDLGHSVVRGHVANVGDEPVLVRFGRHTNDKDKPKFFKDWYKLVPAEVLDFTFYFDVVEFKSTLPSELQFFAQ